MNGTARAADNYGYDNQQRVTSGPETSGSVSAYSYAGTSSPSTFTSANTVDDMGIQAMPQPGAASQLGGEYAGNGQLCWVGVITSTHTGSCASPGSTSSSYETFSYDAMGNRIATTATGYGATTDLTWDVDTGTLSCLNTAGATCTTPSSSTPNTSTDTYNSDGLRMSQTTWNAGSSATQTAHYTWDGAASALLSDGTFDYLYGPDPSVPIAQVDLVDSVTAELLTDRSSNLRAVVEVSSSAASPNALLNSTDYDTYGNPLTNNAGSVNPGGVSHPVAGDIDSATNFGFGGGYLDGTGMVYLVHRYLDPISGEFLSVDPMVASTRAAFTYAEDNPNANTDPSGLYSECPAGTPAEHEVTAHPFNLYWNKRAAEPGDHFAHLRCGLPMKWGYRDVLRKEVWLYHKIAKIFPLDEVFHNPFRIVVWERAIRWTLQWPDDVKNYHWDRHINLVDGIQKMHFWMSVKLDPRNLDILDVWTWKVPDHQNGWVAKNALTPVDQGDFFGNEANV